MFLFKRGKYYHLEYFDDIENRVKRVSAKSTKKAQAIKFLTDFQKRIQDNHKPHHILLSTYAKRYQDYLAANCSKKYLKTVSLSFRQLSQFTGDIALSKLTYHQLDQFMNITFKRTQHGAWTNYRALKSAFNKAVNWGYLTDNPFNRKKLPKIAESTPLFIDESEFKLIVTNTECRNLKDIFLTAMNSGLRLSELINLKWSSVNLRGRTLLVQNYDSFRTKNKKPSIIPLNNTLFQLLQNRLPKIIDIKLDDYLFSKYPGVPYSNEYVSKRFKRIVRKLGLNEKYHFHLLRVSFGSHLLQKGIPISTISKLLGHSSIYITEKHYISLSIENLTEAVLTLDKQAVSY
ncbi:MAG: tyrosine-type recombinase/integrase [Bacteroidetes bacterium]|nr:tyrosine-type recombinase/integrase [Bacteroidota bacterium]